MHINIYEGTHQYLAFALYERGLKTILLFLGWVDIYSVLKNTMNSVYSLYCLWMWFLSEAKSCQTTGAF